MARLYSNENFPFPAVVALRALGHDVLTSLDSGRANQRIPDEDVVTFATADNRVVLTLDWRDFHRLHGRSTSHAGIITCRVDTDYVRLAGNIDQEIKAQATLSGKLLEVHKP